MRTSLIACASAVLGVLALAGLAMGDDADDLERLRTETARLVGICDTLGPELEYDRDVFGREVRKVDALARMVVTNLFKKHRDFDAVKKASEGVIQWREWPRNATVDAFMSFLQSDRKEKALQVNYRTWTGPNDEVLYVLQATFRNRPPYLYHDRICPTMWLVMVKGDKVTATTLPDLGIRGTNPAGFPMGSSPSVLGFTDEGTTLPGILVLSGPYGGGRYCSFHLYAKDGKDGAWQEHYVDGRDAYPHFSYDEEKRELRSTMVIGPTQLHRKARPMRVFCDRTGPLVMNLSTVPGADYTPREAPLVITVTNTSDKAIQMLMRFTDERIFRTDEFYLWVRQVDGKAVQCVAKFHTLPVPVKDEKTYQEIAPKEKFQIKVDLAKTVKNLKEGEYLLSLHWANRWDENSFGGHVRAPDIKVVIKPGK